jgi:hypothetical protein
MVNSGIPNWMPNLYSVDNFKCSTILQQFDCTQLLGMLGLVTAHLHTAMAQIIEEEKISLYNENGVSTRLWMDRLKAENICVFLKDKITHSPPGSNLNEDTFAMCLQTPFQMDVF